MRYPVESSTDMVFQAVVSLREADQVATRETVADITALKLSVVDDGAGHDWYAVIVCRDGAEKERLMKLLKVPNGEVYIPPAEIFAMAEKTES